MNRREVLGAIGVGAASLTAFSARRAAGDEGEHAHEPGNEHLECLKNCSECAKTCDHAFHHALRELGEGKKIPARTVQLLSDCAKFCGLSACMIADHSQLMDHSCAACAEACKKTAEACEACEVEVVKRAVKSLRECEKSCRSMVASMRGEHHHAVNTESKPSGLTRQ